MSAIVPLITCYISQSLLSILDTARDAAVYTRALPNSISRSRLLENWPRIDCLDSVAAEKNTKIVTRTLFETFILEKTGTVTLKETHEATLYRPAQTVVTELSSAHYVDHHLFGDDIRITSKLMWLLFALLSIVSITFFYLIFNTQIRRHRRPRRSLAEAIALLTGDEAQSQKDIHLPTLFQDPQTGQWNHPEQSTSGVTRLLSVESLITLIQETVAEAVESKVRTILEVRISPLEQKVDNTIETNHKREEAAKDLANNQQASDAVQNPEGSSQSVANGATLLQSEESRSFDLNEILNEYLGIQDPTASREQQENYVISYLEHKIANNVEYSRRLPVCTGPIHRTGIEAAQGKARQDSLYYDEFKIRDEIIQRDRNVDDVHESVVLKEWAERIADTYSVIKNAGDCDPSCPSRTIRIPSFWPAWRGLARRRNVSPSDDGDEDSADGDHTPVFPKSTTRKTSPTDDAEATEANLGDDVASPKSDSRASNDLQTEVRTNDMQQIVDPVATDLSVSVLNLPKPLPSPFNPRILTPSQPAFWATISDKLPIRLPTTHFADGPTSVFQTDIAPIMTENITYGPSGNASQDDQAALSIERHPATMQGSSDKIPNQAEPLTSEADPTLLEATRQSSDAEEARGQPVSSAIDEKDPVKQSVPPQDDSTRTPNQATSPPTEGSLQGDGLVQSPLTSHDHINPQADIASQSSQPSFSNNGVGIAFPSLATQTVSSLAQETATEVDIHQLPSSTVAKLDAGPSWVQQQQTSPDVRMSEAQQFADSTYSYAQPEASSTQMRDPVFDTIPAQTLPQEMDFELQQKVQRPVTALQEAIQSTVIPEVAMRDSSPAEGPHDRSEGQRSPEMNTDMTDIDPNAVLPGETANDIEIEMTDASPRQSQNQFGKQVPYNQYTISPGLPSGTKFTEIEQSPVEVQMQDLQVLYQPQSFLVQDVFQNQKPIYDRQVTPQEQDLSAQQAIPKLPSIPEKPATPEHRFPAGQLSLPEFTAPISGQQSGLYDSGQQNLISERVISPDEIPKPRELTDYSTEDRPRPKTPLPNHMDPNRDHISPTQEERIVLDLIKGVYRRGRVICQEARGFYLWDPAPGPKRCVDPFHMELIAYMLALVDHFEVVNKDAVDAAYFDADDGKIGHQIMRQYVDLLTRSRTAVAQHGPECRPTLRPRARRGAPQGTNEPPSRQLTGDALENQMKIFIDRGEQRARDDVSELRKPLSATFKPTDIPLSTQNWDQLRHTEVVEDDDGIDDPGLGRSHAARLASEDNGGRSAPSPEANLPVLSEVAKGKQRESSESSEETAESTLPPSLLMPGTVLQDWAKPPYMRNAARQNQYNPTGIQLTNKDPTRGMNLIADIHLLSQSNPKPTNITATSPTSPAYPPTGPRTPGPEVPRDEYGNIISPTYRPKGE